IAGHRLEKRSDPRGLSVSLFEVGLQERILDLENLRKPPVRMLLQECLAACDTHVAARRIDGVVPILGELAIPLERRGMASSGREGKVLRCAGSVAARDGEERSGHHQTHPYQRNRPGSSKRFHGILPPEIEEKFDGTYACSSGRESPPGFSAA